MHYCIELAQEGAGSVAPNPLVGAVLVYNDRIIGAGYHKIYGEAHAEVNCLASVQESDKHFIKESTLYVSLEPCAHFGKTPPCSQLIIDAQIPNVVIACSDPFAKVNGKGIAQLKAAGIQLETGCLESEAIVLNKRFFVFHQKKRPYIILKWAETINQKISNFNNERLLISNEVSNRLVHRWRSEEAAIMVGTQTALKDNPTLTNRFWRGKNPIRILIDQFLKIPINYNIYNSDAETIVFNAVKMQSSFGIHFVQIDFKKEILEQILNYCYEANIQSLIIEGGAKLIQSFIDEGLWDEARVIQSQTISVNEGLSAPIFKENQLVEHYSLNTDTVFIYQHDGILSNH